MVGLAVWRLLTGKKKAEKEEDKASKKENLPPSP
jgi:hypothetical protein